MGADERQNEERKIQIRLWLAVAAQNAIRWQIRTAHRSFQQQLNPGVAFRQAGGAGGA